MYVYGFRWPVRTLRFKDQLGCYQNQGPAMAAKVTDHVWPISEWMTFSAVRR
jgi:hypothetical protein